MHLGEGTFFPDSDPDNDDRTYGTTDKDKEKALATAVQKFNFKPTPRPQDIDEKLLKPEAAIFRLCLENITPLDYDPDNDPLFGDEASSAA